MGKKLSTRREKESEMKIPRTQKEQNLFNYLVDKIRLQRIRWILYLFLEDEVRLIYILAWVTFTHYVKECL